MCLYPGQPMHSCTGVDSCFSTGFRVIRRRRGQQGSQAVRTAPSDLKKITIRKPFYPGRSTYESQPHFGACSHPPPKAHTHAVQPAGPGKACFHYTPNNSASLRRITPASTSTPVQYLMPITPWLTTMPRPSRALQPRASASRISRVRGGLGTTSATIIPGSNVSVSRFNSASTSGNSPTEVALMRISVSTARTSARTSRVSWCGRSTGRPRFVHASHHG